MNKFIVFKVGIILTAIILLASCKKEESTLPIQDATYNSELNKEGKIVLGKKLENPYTVENMKRAYAELKREYAEKEGGDTLEDINIYTTNLYVRFLPKDITEYDTLVSDTTLEIFDFPLDYEITGEGTYYHDPSLPENQITWQYCAPKVNKELPEIESEVIEELYLPKEDPKLNKIEKNGNNIADLLEMKSLQITGNLTDEEYKAFFEKGSSWKPNGSVKAEDDVLTSVPVQGVEVIIWDWFYTSSTTTSASGNFQFNSTWNGNVSLKLKFQNYYFDIRNGVLLQATFNGPKISSRWDKTFQKNVDNYEPWRYCHIFRAAYTYYNNTSVRGGLSRPAIRNSGLKIAYVDSEKGFNGVANPYTQYIALQSIRIAGRTDTEGWRSSDGIFATTIHELAHSSHWDLIGTVEFTFTDNRVLETWATGVQWFITHKIYPAYKGRGTSMPNYTQFVVDLVDGFSDVTNNGISGTDDNVTGYSMVQIESTLKGSKTPNEWRNNIRNKLTNTTENAELDILYNRWF